MSELKPCDFLDNEIFVGDEVAFFALGYRMFTRGTVVKITNKCLFIDYDNSWNYDHHEEHTRQGQRQVIDLTALNRRAQPANEPLTLEQLREMERRGEGIYVTHADGSPIDRGKQYTAAVLDRIAAFGAMGYHLQAIYGRGLTLAEDDCGKTWLAYRRPPERSENDA